MSLDLGIVILNWNTRDLLRDCLRSVYASRGVVNYAVCVVDNASSDGSAAMLRAEFPAVRVVESPVNGGYAAGNNFLYSLGASGGAPSTQCRSAQICNVGQGGCTTTPPELRNWNSGFTQAVARYLHATAVESGFIFLLGGQTDTEAASATTERTNF